MSDEPDGRAQARFLTPEEAAAFLRLSPRTLEKHRVLVAGPAFASSAGRSSTPSKTSRPGPMPAASR